MSVSHFVQNLSTLLSSSDPLPPPTSSQASHKTGSVLSGRKGVGYVSEKLGFSALNALWESARLVVGAPNALRWIQHGALIAEKLGFSQRGLGLAR